MNQLTGKQLPLHLLLLFQPEISSWKMPFYNSFFFFFFLPRAQEMKTSNAHASTHQPLTLSLSLSLPLQICVTFMIAVCF